MARMTQISAVQTREPLSWQRLPGLSFESGRQMRLPRRVSRKIGLWGTSLPWKTKRAMIQFSNSG